MISSNGGGASASISLGENGTAVTTVSASDPDAGAAVDYVLVGGADQSKFTIDASGVLSFLAAPDFDAPGDADGDNVYEVAVEVSDGLGGIDIQTLAVTVTNANEAPVIVSDGGGATAAITVGENAAAVTTVSASDPDAGAVLTYALVGGADQSKFSIDGSGVLTFLARARLRGARRCRREQCLRRRRASLRRARRQRRPDACGYGDQRPRGAGHRLQWRRGDGSDQCRRERHRSDDGVGEQSRRRRGAELCHRRRRRPVEIHHRRLVRRPDLPGGARLRGAGRCRRRQCLRGGGRGLRRAWRHRCPDARGHGGQRQ